MEESIAIGLLILIFGISVIGTIVFICCCDCDSLQKHSEEMDSLLDV